MRIVCDATVATKWYLPEAYSEESIALLDSGRTIVVPDLLIAQVGNVLWQRVRTGAIKPEIAGRSIRNLLRLPLERVPTSDLATDAQEIAAATTRTFNESIFFALAIREQTPLVTADFRWYSLLNTGPLRKHVRFVGHAEGESGTQSAS